MNTNFVECVDKVDKAMEKLAQLIEKKIDFEEKEFKKDRYHEYLCTFPTRTLQNVRYSTRDFLCNAYNIPEHGSENWEVLFRSYSVYSQWGFLVYGKGLTSTLLKSPSFPELWKMMGNDLDKQFFFRTVVLHDQGGTHLQMIVLKRTRDSLEFSIFDSNGISVLVDRTKVLILNWIGEFVNGSKIDIKFKALLTKKVNYSPDNWAKAYGGVCEMWADMIAVICSRFPHISLQKFVEYASSLDQNGCQVLIKTYANLILDAVIGGELDYYYENQCPEPSSIKIAVRKTIKIPPVSERCLYLLSKIPVISSS